MNCVLIALFRSARWTLLGLARQHRKNFVPAPLDVDALADDVRVEVGRLPSAEVHLAVRGAVEDDVVADLLHGARKRLRGRGQQRIRRRR